MRQQGECAAARRRARSQPGERDEIAPDRARARMATFHGGFFTPSDSTGDIHKFTRGLAQACERHGVEFRYDTEITSIAASPRRGLHASPRSWRASLAADV